MDRFDFKFMNYFDVAERSRTGGTFRDKQLAKEELDRRNKIREDKDGHEVL